MGLFAPPAAFLSRRLGSRHALAAALALIGVFGIARALVPGAALLILLTIPVGIGMGLGNALLPVGVKERFADRPVFATGVYAAGINVGATVSSASAVPLEHALGDWRDPLLVFSAVTLGLFVLWLVLTRVERGNVAASAPRPLALPWRSSLGWRLVAAFFFMSATYYGLNAWLPDVYVERGWSEGEAGALLAVLNGTQIAAGLAVAWLADRMWSRRTLDGGLRRARLPVDARRRAAPRRGLPLGVPARRHDRPALLADDGAAARHRARPGRGGRLHRPDAGRRLLALGDVAVRARRDPRREQRLSTSCSGCSSA